MPGITRGVRTFSTNVVFARSSRCLPRRTPTSETHSFRRIFPIAFRLRFWSRRGFSTFVLIVAETTCVSSCAVSFCFPLIALTLLPLSAHRFPFAFRWCSCLESFISGLKFPGSDLLIHTSLHHSLQFLAARLSILLFNILFDKSHYGF